MAEDHGSRRSLEVDLEKVQADELSIHTPSSSSRHGSGPAAAKDDVEAQNDDRTGDQIEDFEITKTTTRVSLKGGITRVSTKSSWKDPGPPPDGGVTAWTQVLMGHLVIMCTWGFINSFGVFQSYYVTALSRPPSDISWVGSIQVFLLFFVGTFSGRLTDGGYFREVFAFGSILQIIGIFMTSLSTKYWQLFLAQGVCCGLGNGCLFCPSVSLVSTYFSSKRALAIGLCAAGSATGGLVFPVMVQQLLPRIGFGWTIRALGFLELGLLILCNIFTKPRLPPRRAGPIVEWSAFREMPYLLFAVGMFFTFWGVYFAFFYIGSFARDIVDLSYTTSINLILVLNGVGYAGRIIPNYVADRYTGPLNAMIPTAICAALIMYLMSLVVSQAGLYAWASFYGLIGAAIQSLFPAILASLTTDLRKRGTRMGMTFTIVSFAVLTGPPIAGQLVTAKHGEYLYAQVFAATSIATGSICMTFARLARTGFVWKAKM
jgi:MFS family permease